MITTCPKCGWQSPDGEEILRCARCCYTKEFMDYTEFGKLVGTCAVTVRRWEKTGHIKTTHFGARITRIHRSEYERLAGLTEGNAPRKE